jgi:hypothetical protein
MKKIFSSIWTFLILGMILGGAIAPQPAQAENALESCLENAVPFLTSLLDRSNFNDYWLDFVARNRCQQDDIFALDDETEILFDELMNKFEEECNSEEIPRLKDEIRWNKMELFFLRNIVDTTEITEDSATEKDIDEQQKAIEEKTKSRMIRGVYGELETENSDGFKMDTTQMFDDMNEKFGEEGKGWLTETELTEAINTWVEDYDYRIPLYYDCNYSPWQEVADKMRELVDTISALNDPSSFSEQVAEMDKEFQDMRADLMEDVDPGGGEKDAPAGKGVVKNFFKKHFAIKIQAIDPPKKKEELLEEAAAEGQNLDVGEILTATESENSTYNLAAKKAELEGNFWASYREDSGAITTDLVSKIGQLSGIVTLSTTDANLLPGLRDSAKALRKKQGKGTPGG